jgi:hypothetical protein
MVGVGRRFRGVQLGAQPVALLLEPHQLLAELGQILLLAAVAALTRGELALQRRGARHGGLEVVPVCHALPLKQRGREMASGGGDCCGEGLCRTVYGGVRPHGLTVPTNSGSHGGVGQALLNHRYQLDKRAARCQLYG